VTWSEFKSVVPKGLLCLVLPSLAAAAAVEKELEGIKKKIEVEQRGISQARKNEGSVLGALERIEKELEDKNRELKKLGARLARSNENLQKAEAESRKVRASLEQRKKLLETRLRALYKWQKVGSPGILLNGEMSLAEMMRRKRYLETMLARDQELVGQFLSEAARYDELRRKVVEEGRELTAEKTALVKVKESIGLERERKRAFLVTLRKEKDAHSRALKELEQSALRLQKMIEEMSRRAVTRSAPVGTGFEAKRGTLDYPVRGEIVEGFGKTTHPDFAAQIFRKGIDIEAALGEEVKAVDAGTVIFADRFTGYGRMLILDHGQRYYTVYAHLGEILKSPGAAVQKGETIASVGDSGSLKGPRLYFEIRKDGKPVDPVAWLRKR
jgi:septal ring factor EnvC (AmiA/AmiB activator)